MTDGGDQDSVENRDPPYRLRISGPAVTAITRTLPEKVATAVYEFITGPLVANPRRIGKPLEPPLEPPLAPTYSARRGAYRALYLIDDERRVVEVTAVRHRADAYHS